MRSEGTQWLLVAVVFDAIVLELLMKRVAIDAQSSRRFGLHMIAFGQNLDDQLPLDSINHATVEIRILRTRRINALLHHRRRQRIEIGAANRQRRMWLRLARHIRWQ